MSERENEREVIARMVKVENNGCELVERLMGEFRMTEREIAEYVGVNRPVVAGWKSGKWYAKAGHYDKLQEMCLRLASKGVRYPHQAMDVLTAEDEGRA